MQKNLEKLIKKFIDLNGEDYLRDYLISTLGEQKECVLTVITSEDTHNIPEDIIRGDKYVVYKGDLDTSDKIILQKQIEKALLGLVKKLKKKKWNKIYFIPSGFPELSIMTKLLIYRVTRIDSIDLVYAGNGKYVEISLNSRALSGSQKL